MRKLVGKKETTIDTTSGLKTRVYEYYQSDLYDVIKIFTEGDKRPHVHTGKRPYIAKIWAKILRGKYSYE